MTTSATSTVPAAPAPQPDEPFAAQAPLAHEGRPGYTGMWIGITCELFEFAVFFAVYFVMRWNYPTEFREGAPQLWTLGGLLITLVMLTSGYFLVRTVLAVRRNAQRAARWWMVAAFATALCYPVIKYFELVWNFERGVIAGYNAFFTVYYYLTINHFIHSFWGMLGMIWVTIRLWQGAYHPGNAKAVESMAIYWHATDLVWLMLFSLFYAFV